MDFGALVGRVAAEFTPGAAGIWLLVALAFVAFWREWRETRKLSADDRLARREGYARQVADLTAENRAQRQEIADIRSEHEEYRRLCHAETDQLRKHVVDLENLVAGLQRQLASAAVSVARQIGKGVLGNALEEAAAQLDEEGK